MTTILSNYPGGFRGGVNIRGWPLFEAQAGSVFWVDSTTGSNGNTGKTRERPLATLDYAIGKCTANKGDVIMVMPNHAETVTGVAGIALDVAGITVVGMGSGNQRPRFLMDGATTVTAAVSAADVTLKNMVFAAGTNTTATCFTVTGVNATFEDIEIEDNTTDEHFLAVFSATGADNSADGLTVRRCKWVTIDAGVTDFISFTGSANRVTVEDNFFCADAATGAGLILCATGKILTGLSCIGNKFICGNTAGDILIDNDATTNTGIVAWNLVGHHDVAAVIIVDIDGCRQFQNYSVGSDTESGVLMPAADSLT